MKYESEISEARQMAELLRHKLARVEEKLRVLEGLQSNEDPFLEMVRKEFILSVSKSHMVFKTPVRLATTKKLSTDQFEVLDFIGEGRSLNEITAMLLQKGKIAQGQEAKARKIMLDLKSQHCVVDNPKRGFYKLNEKGKEAVKNELA